MTNNLISIIVPIYNQEKYLCQGIESLIKQTYKNLEIILVDDGSTDNSLSICQQYAKTDKRIKIISKQNGGVSSARNSGLTVANGDFIGFMDGDDWVELDMFETLLNSIIKNNSDVSVCQIKRGTKIISYRNFENPFLYFKYNPKAPCVYNKLFKKEFLTDLYFNNNLRYSEDFLFCLQVLLKISKISVVPNILYNYRINPESAVMQPFSRRRLDDFKALRIARRNILKNLNNWKRYIFSYEACLSCHHLIFTQISYNKQILIKFMHNKIRNNLFYFLLAPRYSIKSKIFAIFCCLNLPLSFKICRFANKFISK